MPFIIVTLIFFFVNDWNSLMFIIGQDQPESRRTMCCVALTSCLMTRSISFIICLEKRSVLMSYPLFLFYSLEYWLLYMFPLLSCYMTRTIAFVAGDIAMWICISFPVDCRTATIGLSALVFINGWAQVSS